MKTQIVKPQSNTKKEQLLLVNNNSHINTKQIVSNVADKNKSITTPLIFEKKIKKSIVKPLKYIINDSGLIKYNPLGGGHAWYNNIYAYNKNYIKSLPALDKSLSTLLKSYCNMWPKLNKYKTNPILLNKYISLKKKQSIKFKGKPLKKKNIWDIKQNNNLKPITLWRRNKDGIWRKNPLNLYKRLTPKKVFVDKGNLKHTSNKVIVTLYTYNIQKLHLLRMIKKLLNCFFLTKLPLVRYKTFAGDRRKAKLIPVIIKKKGAKMDRKKKVKEWLKNWNTSYKPKFITVYKKETIKLTKVLLFNRRLTLNEYLNSSYTVLNQFINDPEDSLTMSKKKRKRLFIPLSFTDKVEKLSKMKEKVLESPHISSYYFNLLSYTTLKVTKVTSMLKKLLKYHIYLTKLVKNNILNEKEKLLIFINVANKFNIYKYPQTRFIKTKFKAKKIYLASLLRVAWLLYVNDVKFKHPMLVSRLKYLVSSLYGKEVEFNLVELKKMHLSSDIYTQIVALKLRNKKNKLYRVLKWSLRKINIPNVNRLNERYHFFDKDAYFPNKIRNTYIESMLSDNSNTNSLDVLNQSMLDNKTGLKSSLDDLLKGLFHEADKIKGRLRYKRKYTVLSKDKKWVNGKKKSIKVRKFSMKYKKIRGYLLGHVLWTLKFGKICGIRVEAKGRLTRRRTAQRSVFKMRYKGGLENVDSSFRGMSAVMLRGFIKTNVQYSLVQSKNRIGAYGIKGWVGYKMLSDGLRPSFLNKR